MLRAALFTSAVMTALLAPPTVASAQYGPAPWCAVLNTGNGAVYWDCQYESAAACAPHVISGNRGFCNRNPAYGARRDDERDCRIVRHHVWRDGRRVVVRERRCR